MTVKAVLAGSFAVLAFAGCGKDTPAGHVAGELDKAQQEAELRSHKFASKCENTNLVLSVVGVKSQNSIFDIQNAQAGKTIQFFSTDNCAAGSIIGQATYAGTQDLGGDAGDGSRTLDLNYMTVSVTITSADLANGLNSLPGQLVNCGINDWAPGVARDVTAVSGSGSCMAVPKPSPTYDIVKTDGRTTFFGLKDSAHNAQSQPARPVVLDRDNAYTAL